MFLESFWFPLLLAAALFPAAWALRRCSPRRAAADTSSSPERMQFGLASLLGGMLLVAALLGVGRWTIFGAYSLAMVVAAFLMIDTVLYYPAQRLPAKRMLLTALANLSIDALLLGGTWVIATTWHRGEPNFVAQMFLVLGGGIFLFGPLVTIVVGTIWAATSRRFSRRAALGFATWQLGVCFGHFWYFVKQVSLAS